MRDKGLASHLAKVLPTPSPSARVRWRANRLTFSLIPHQISRSQRRTPPSVNFARPGSQRTRGGKESFVDIPIGPPYLSALLLLRIYSYSCPWNGVEKGGGGVLLHMSNQPVSVSEYCG